MKRPWIQKVAGRIAGLMAVVAMGCALAMAQAAQAGGQGTDGQIEMDVVHALDAQQSLANDLIAAATVNGKVTLTGTVSSEAAKELAEHVVRGVAGVVAVENKLQVGNPASDANAQAGQMAGTGATSEDNGPPSDAGTPTNPPQWGQQPDQTPNESANNDANEPPMNQGPMNQGEQAGNGQAQPDWGPAGPPPGYEQGKGAPGQGPGQAQGQEQGQTPQAGGQNPPDWGPAGPPPGWDQGQGQGEGPGQMPPPGQPGYGQGPYAQGPYGQGPNGGYPQARGPYGPQYGEQGRPNYRIAQGPVTVAEGTLLQVRTDEPVSSKRAVPGTPVQFTVIRGVTVGGVLAIPRGATVHGVVEEVRQTQRGEVSGRSDLALRLTSLDLGGRNYPLASDLFKVRGPNKAGRTVGNAVGGALVGAIIGAAAGGGTGAAVGAVAGGTVGTAATAATQGPGVWIPAEALVSFHLAQPVTVAPVSQEEANRLAQGLYRGGPRLYRRPRPYRYYGGYGAPYGPYGPYGYAGYGYPGPYSYYGPVFYRPYIYAGGFYSWR